MQTAEGGCPSPAIALPTATAHAATRAWWCNDLHWGRLRCCVAVLLLAASAPPCTPSSPPPLLLMSWPESIVRGQQQQQQQQHAEELGTPLAGERLHNPIAEKGDGVGDPEGAQWAADAWFITVPKRLVIRRGLWLAALALLLGGLGLGALILVARDGSGGDASEAGMHNSKLANGTKVPAPASPPPPPPPAPGPMFGSCNGLFMDCRGAASCAVLVLETGMGSGYYRHVVPSVHGLWPQNGHYGNSACVPPLARRAMVGYLPACYDTVEARQDLAHQQSFVQHEWTKHGACAGTADEASYFDTICRMAREGTRLIDNTQPLQTIAATLYSHGLPVHCVDNSNQQIYISACASRNTTSGVLGWKCAPFASYFNFSVSAICLPSVDLPDGSPRGVQACCAG
jgi:hypothetical protein